MPIVGAVALRTGILAGILGVAIAGLVLAASEFYYARKRAQNHRRDGFRRS